MTTYPRPNDPVETMTRADGTNKPHSNDHGKLIDFPSNPSHYGARGDGTGNDLAALNDAVDDTPEGGTLHLTGMYRITSTLTIDKRINVIGFGPATGFNVDVGSGNDGVIFMRTGELVAGVVVGNFAVAGTLGSSRKSLVFRNYISSRFKDLWIRSGASDWGVSFQGCLVNEIGDITVSSNWPLPVGFTAGALPENGVEFRDYTNANPLIGTLPSNANKVFCIIEGLNGTGLANVSTQANGGNNWIRGIYESNGQVTGRDIHMSGCTSAHIADCHVEQNNAGDGGVLLYDSRDCTVGPAAFLANTPLAIQGDSHRNTIDGVLCDGFTIDDTVHDTEVRKLTYGSFAAPYVDLGLRTRVTGHIVNLGSADATATGASLYDAVNLLPNGGGERWSAGAPVDWGTGGVVTFTKTGVALGDTTKKFGNYAAKVAGGTTTITILAPGSLAPLALGQWITATAWIYIPSGQGANVPSIYLQAYNDVTANSTPATSTPTDTWFPLRVKTRVPTNATGVGINVVNENTAVAGVYYLDGCSYVVGSAGPIAGLAAPGETTGSVYANIGATGESVLGLVGPSAEAALKLQDVSLYRHSAANVKTAATILSDASIYAFHDNAKQVGIGNVGPSAESAIYFQQGEIKVYRIAANSLAMTASAAFRTGTAVHGSLPSAASFAAGMQFYCSTDKQPLWSDGTNWVEADGTNH